MHKIGQRERPRSPNLWFPKPVLCHLSYSLMIFHHGKLGLLNLIPAVSCPILWASPVVWYSVLDSNQRLMAYQATTLASELTE